jgi:DNA-binding MarR family transcriptional regulator
VICTAAATQYLNFRFLATLQFCASTLAGIPLTAERIDVKSLPIWKYTKMEETFDLTEQTAEQLLELLQLFALHHYRFIPPEHVIRLQQQLDSSERGSGDQFSNYPVLLRIFSFLAHADIPPTMSELGIALETPLSSTTRIVDWLVRAKFIERVGDPKDRRIVRVRLTENGREIYHTGMDFNKKQLMNLLAIYTPEEQEQLLRLMNKLVHYIPAGIKP